LTAKYARFQGEKMSELSHQEKLGQFSEGKCQACADHFSCSWRLFYERKPCPAIPWNVWAATGLLFADAVFSVFRLFGEQQLIEGAVVTVLSVVLIVGLACRAKWAFVGTLIYAGVAVILGVVGHLNVAAVVINGMIILLVWTAFHAYFPKPVEPAQDFLDRMPPPSDVPPPTE
jgi:hypothetical protein